MSTLKQQIGRMYAEIVEHNGAFGEPIDHGSYNPYGVIRDPTLTSFERTGVSVAVLHYLDSAIENATYERAVADHERQIRALLAEGRFDDLPVLRQAAEAFLESEYKFLGSLKPVFTQVVRPQFAGPPAA